MKNQATHSCRIYEPEIRRPNLLWKVTIKGHTHIHTHTQMREQKFTFKPRNSSPKAQDLNHCRGQVFLRGQCLTSQDSVTWFGPFPEHNLEERRAVGTFKNTMVPEMVHLRNEKNCRSKYPRLLQTHHPFHKFTQMDPNSGNQT